MEVRERLGWSYPVAWSRSGHHLLRIFYGKTEAEATYQ